MNYRKIIIGIALLAVGLPVGAQGTVNKKNPHATVKRERVLPLVTSKIKLLTRTYGDSIVLRWAPEDYVSWKYLAQTGVNVLRVPKGDGHRGLQIDTLAYALKPLSLEQFRARYPETDSVALVPQGVLYGETENRKSERDGTMGRSLEYNSEQDMAFGFAMLAAEWRKDLAEAMAVRFTDRTAKPGATYDYYIQPTVWENGGQLIFEPGVAEDVVNKPYEPKSYMLDITDSLSTPMTLVLNWHDHEHSSFEVERRFVRDMKGVTYDDTAWERITRKPYVSMVEQAENEDLCVIGDSVPRLGVWEYRILGYDACADLNEPSTPHRVVVRDMEPPSAPLLKYIVLERPDDDPSTKVYAHIVWEKPVIEDDLAGYRIYYSSNRQQSEAWRSLNQDLINPLDTIYKVDVTKMGTSMVYVAAYDDWGNEARSFVQMLRVDDYEAPPAPTDFKAQVEKDGRVILAWNTPADDVAYYQVAFANDTTHQWNILSNSGLIVPTYTDTLAMDLNQKYIFYKVRAVDYSTNEGDWSKVLRVKRPTFLIPAVAHLDSAWVNADGIHMEWVTGADEQMNRHYVYRWQEGDKQRTVIARCDADSVKAAGNIIRIDDAPPFDKKRRYNYAVESFNTSHISSGLSLIYSAKRRPPLMVEGKIELAGDYMTREAKTKLVWSVTGMKEQLDHYFCVYRLGEGEDTYQNVTTTTQDVTEYEDLLLKPGQKAEFYVKLRTKDGRESRPSNVITVSAPAKK